MKREFPDPLLSNPLTGEEIDLVVKLLLGSEVTDEAKGTFLTSLNRRGETAGELAGFAKAILAGAVQPRVSRDSGAPLLELCGTGGDHAGLLNISTAAMFVAAGAGARVVKHGNRAVSSRCGSADVLEALGISLHPDPSRVEDVLERAGCVFLLASHFHPTFAVLAPLRRSLASQGQLTVFSLLGPLLNPAIPDFQVTGIYAEEKLGLYAEALGLIGRRASWAVHGNGSDGSGGFDELSITGPSRCASFRDGKVDYFSVVPSDFGLPTAPSVTPLIGGDAAENARRISLILTGAEKGAAREMIVLNAAAALHVTGMAPTLREAAAMASESIDSGRAGRAINLLREASRASEAVSGKTS